MATAETKEGFQFYLRFAKPLVLNLPSAKDRVLAAAWVQKLKDEKSGSEKARTDHLKLLLFVLQKGRLFGPFINNPAQHDTLEEFPVAIKLRDIAKQWVESEEIRKRTRLMEGLGAGDFPPLTTECSADLREYVAAQDIPNFGVHAYYAISNEPVTTWEDMEKGIFPKGALSVLRKAESADISAATSKRSRQRSRSRSKTLDDSDVSGRDRSSMAQVSFIDEFGDRPYPGKPEREKPLSPLGSPLPPERASPTWGSNLISVGDPPSPEGMKFAPAKESTTGVDKTASKSLSLKDLSAFSLPYKTPPWDMSAPSLPYQTPVRCKLDFADADTAAFSPSTLPAIPEKFSYPEPSPKTSTPIVGLYLPPMGEGEVSDIFMEEPPSFLVGDELMMTPPPASRSRLEEAPSLPYRTPPWDMTAPSVPYQTPEWDMPAPSLPYQTPEWDMSAASLPYQTPTLPYQKPVRRRLDFSDALSPITLPPIPEKLSYPDLSPRRPTPFVSRKPPSPPLPQEEASFLFDEEAPSFFADEDIMGTPTSGISPFDEAASLPYQTPPWDMTAPSLPYQTPPWDMSAPSIPYQSPEWDMTAPSVPYRTPEWDISAASLPYATPPYDPVAIAEAQYASLFDSPRVATSSPVARRRSPSRTPTTAPLLSEDDIGDVFATEDTLESTEDFSAIEKWAEGPSEAPPAVLPRKRRTPKAEVEEVLAKGISASPAAADIVDEAMKEMSIVDEEQVDLEQLYEEEEGAFPHRHRGMRTPPVFSKSSRIRHAGRHIRYQEEEFGLAEPLEWRPAEEEFASITRPTSPPEDFRDKFRPRAFKDVFPGIEMPIDYVPFDEEDEIELVDDEQVVRSPKKRDLQKRLHDVIDEIDKIGDEMPVMGGVGLTTPKRSPSPVRPDREDDELFFFTEKPPEGFGMSPEDYLSPKSRAALQWAQLQESPFSPERERTPSPPRIETPEFLRKQRWDALPTKEFFPPVSDTESEPETAPEPPISKRKKRRKAKPTISEATVSTVTDEEYETEEEIVDEQAEELYKSLIQPEEEELPPPRTPTPPRAPTPPRPPSPPRSPDIQLPKLPEIPPRFDATMFQTPPRRRITKEEFPEALEFEEEPYFEEPWLTSPPTPPSPFEYESPQLSPLGDSPPIKELVEAHEFTDNFFDPDRPHMRKSILLPGGKRVPVQRHSRAPPLSPIRDEHLEGLFPSPPPGDAFERALEMARQFAPPTPTPPRVQPSTAPSESAEVEVCKKAPPKGTKTARSKMKPSTSKTKVKRTTSKTKVEPSTSKSKIKKPKTSKIKAKASAIEPSKPPSPVAGPSREETPPPPSTPPGRPMFAREVHRPLTRKEHYYLKSFADPKHEDLLARVTRLIADVGFPPLESPPPERDEFEHIEGTEGIDITPPEFDLPADEDLPELSPERPPSPIPQFDFQSDIADFMTPPKPMKLPIVPLTPSQLPRPPPFVPKFIPFPYVSPESPGDYLLDTSPPFIDSPPVTPESPDIDALIFMSEINEAKSPTFHDYMKIRDEMDRFQIVKRHSPAPGVRRVPEIPETAEFEEHMPFYERISSAERPTRRRTVRAGPRRLRSSLAPGLPPVSEQVVYDDSPITTRSPASPPRIVSPPRQRTVVEETEKLIDIPSEPLTPERTPRTKPTTIKRRVTRRRIDFDAPPPSPERPPSEKVKEERRQRRKIDFGEPARAKEFFPEFPRFELTDEELGPPPSELMGEYYPMQYESPKDSVMDYPLPDLPSPTVSPKRFDTPPFLLRPPKPKKEFEFKLMPRLKNILDFQSPIEFPPSPEPLPEEMEESPLATAMPGFAPSPPPTPISPFELPPSPEKKFGRQITPEIKRWHPMAARLVTPPRKSKQPDAALMAAHRQYQNLLMDTPPHAGAQPPHRISPAAGPSTTVMTTSETVISPRERRTTTTRTETTKSPTTPPMMMIPPPHVDPFLEPPDIDIFSEEMPEFMEPSPEEVMRRGVYQAPLRTTRRPVQLYGYGERKPIEIQRKQKAPGLSTVQELADEPTDQYEYWPGPYIPQITRPTPMYSGGKLGPEIYRNVPPVSGKGAVADMWDTVRPYVPPRRIPPQRPITLSPPQTRRKRRERIPRSALIRARKRLQFDELPSPKTYEEHLERLVADVPLPEGDLDVPQLPPAVQIEFEPPAWSPVPIAALERRGMMALDTETPPDWEQFESPRTPRESPGLPSVDVDDMLGDISPPIDLAADFSFSPVGDVSPPPGMEELDELEATPPCSVVCGQSSPEELQRRIREHEYTIHKGDTRKRHLASKYVHVKGKPYKVQKSQAPSLVPLQEQQEPPESPKRKPPPYIPEGTLLHITPPPGMETKMRDLMNIADRQYTMLMDSPERQDADIMERIAMEEYILDQPMGASVQRALPLPITQQFDPGPPLPPLPKIPERYRPPPPTSPEIFSSLAPPHDDYMLDYMESPPLITTPPRDIFAEAMEMPEEEEEDLEALLTGSPVRRTPPGSTQIALDTLLMPKLLEKNSQFTDNKCIQLNTDSEMEARTIQKSTFLHNARAVSHLYTKYPYNDLSYCIGKGLDYFPVKESDTKYTTLPFSFETRNNALLIGDGTISNFFKESNLSPHIDTIAVTNFTFPANNLIPSEFIIAFHYFLQRDESIEQTLPSHISETTIRSVHPTSSPIQLAVPQQQFRRIIPNKAVTTSQPSPNQQIIPFRRYQDTIYNTLPGTSSRTNLSPTEREVRASHGPLNISVRSRDGLYMPRRQALPINLSNNLPSSIPQAIPFRRYHDTIYNTLPGTSSRTNLSPTEREVCASHSPLNIPVRSRNGLYMPRRQALPLNLSNNLPSPIPQAIPFRRYHDSICNTLPETSSRENLSPTERELRASHSPLNISVRSRNRLYMPRRQALPLNLSSTPPSPIPQMIPFQRYHDTICNRLPETSSRGNLSPTEREPHASYSPLNTSVKSRNRFYMPRKQALPLNLSSNLPSPIPQAIPFQRYHDTICNTLPETSSRGNLSPTGRKLRPSYSPLNISARSRNRLYMPRRQALPMNLSSSLPSPIPKAIPLHGYHDTTYNTLPGRNTTTTASPFTSTNAAASIQADSGIAPYSVPSAVPGVGPYATRLATIDSMTVPPSIFNTNAADHNQFPENKNCVQPSIPICACVIEYMNKILRNFIGPSIPKEQSQIQDLYRSQESSNKVQTSFNIAFPDIPRPASERAFDGSVPPISEKPGVLSNASNDLRSLRKFNRLRRGRILTPIRRIRKRLFQTVSPVNETRALYQARDEEDNLENFYDLPCSSPTRSEMGSGPQRPSTFADFQNLQRCKTSTPIRTGRPYPPVVFPDSLREDVLAVQNSPMRSQVEDDSTSYLEYPRRSGRPRQAYVSEDNTNELEDSNKNIAPRKLSYSFPRDSKLESVSQRPHTFADFDYLRTHKTPASTKRVNRRLFQTASLEDEDLEAALRQSPIEKDRGSDLEKSYNDSNFPYSSPRRGEARSVPPRPPDYTDFQNLRRYRTSTSTRKNKRCPGIPSPPDFGGSFANVDNSRYQETDKGKGMPNAQNSTDEPNIEDKSAPYFQTQQMDNTGKDIPSTHQNSMDQPLPEKENVDERENVVLEPPMVKKDATKYIMGSTPKTSIPVSTRSRNISRALSPTQVHDTNFNSTDNKSLEDSVVDGELRPATEICPGCGLDPDRDFSLTGDTLSEDVSKSEYNDKQLFSTIPQHDSPSANNSRSEYEAEPGHNTVGKRVFNPASKSDSPAAFSISPENNSEPDNNIVRKRLFSRTSQRDSSQSPTSKHPSRAPSPKPESESTPAYNECPGCGFAKPLFSRVSKQDSPPRFSLKGYSRPTDGSCSGCDCEAERNRPSRFTSIRNPLSMIPDHSCPGYNRAQNFARRQRSSSTPNRGSSLAYDEYSKFDSEPEYNATRKQLFTSTPKRHSQVLTSAFEFNSKPGYNMVRKQLFTSSAKRYSQPLNNQCPGCTTSSTNMRDLPVIDNSCPGCNSESEYGTNRKQLFISTIKSVPRRFSPDRTMAPDNEAIEAQLTADISRHLDSLPINDTSINHSQFFSVPTHLIISAFGPVRLSTIPNVPFNQTNVGLVNALAQQDKSDERKELDNEIETVDAAPATSDLTQFIDKKLPIESPLPQSSKSPSVTPKSSQVTPVGDKPLPLEGSPSQSKKSPLPTPKSSQVTPAADKSPQLRHPGSETKKTPLVAPKSSKKSPLVTPKSSKKSPLVTPKSSKKSRLPTPKSSKIGPAKSSKQSRICPEMCPQVSTYGKPLLTEKTMDMLDNTSDEDFVRNIILDAELENTSRRPSVKIKEEKSKEYALKDVKETCTSEMCAHVPAEHKLCTNPTCSTAPDERKCPSSACESDASKRSRYTPKYFKNPPCLDISLPSQCVNPRCGIKRTQQNTQELLLEDWADELEVLYDPGYNSIQTQYFHSESLSGSPSYGTQLPGSPVSPDFMRRVREHQFTESFFDPKRPMARKSVRSRENVIRLRRRAPSPPLEQVHEVPEQPISSAGARGLRPAVYPTEIPLSAEKHYTPPYFPDLPRTRRVKTPPLQPPTSPIKSVQRAPPRRRLLFDEPPPSSPERTPDKVTTTETVTYDDPTTGAPITETTVKETVYGRPGSPLMKTPTPQRKKRSPCGPCTPPRMSPREYDISEAFGGRMSPEILDTSDIPEDVDTEPFMWLNR
ncbi:hypothetical protein Trydic_g3360 [Trypoxylus dichotomus]